MDAYGIQRNPKSLKRFIARQPYKNLHLHLLPPFSLPWSAKLKLSALKKRNAIKNKLDSEQNNGKDKKMQVSPAT